LEFIHLAGITPMLQIINAVIKDSGDDTKITLLFANQVWPVFAN